MTTPQENSWEKVEAFGKEALRIRAVLAGISLEPNDWRRIVEWHSTELSAAEEKGYQKGHDASQSQENEMLNIALKDAQNARAEERKEVLKLLDSWTTFTCHTRAEHKKNDCPGWSHEDQKVREIVLEQIKYQIKNLTTQPPQ